MKENGLCGAFFLHVLTENIKVNVESRILNQTTCLFIITTNSHHIYTQFVLSSSIMAAAGMVLCNIEPFCWFMMK